MNKAHLRVILFAVCAASVLIVFSSIAAQAQCSMCRIGVSNSTSAAKLAQSLNFATLILLIPPVTIFCAFFFIAHRRVRPLRPGKDSNGLQESNNPSPLAGAKRS